jgi:hypothetical protein
MVSLAAAERWSHGASTPQYLTKNSVKDVSTTFQGNFADD